MKKFTENSNGHNQPDAGAEAAFNRTGGKRNRKIEIGVVSAAVILLIAAVALVQYRKNQTAFSGLTGPSSGTTAGTGSASRAPDSTAAAPSSTGASSAGSQTSAGSSGSDLKLIDITSTVSAGSEASVSVQGLPDTKYSISLHYSLGGKTPSLEDKVSDANGIVSWTWEINEETAAGTCQVEITGGGRTYPADIEIHP